jgi:NAD(P)-dependent dehydrogenase (short-subunit alcohol dehydrogenase family)
MDLGLRGKRALVTGGSRGLGRGVARELLLEGCRVVVASRTEGPLVQAAKELAEETGGEIHAVPFDVMDGQSIKDCVATAVERLGGLDIVVNAAARTGGHGEEADVYPTASESGMIADYTEKVVGSLRLARAAEPHMKAAGGGRIVLFSGGAGRVRGGLISAGTRNRAINHLAVTLANALGRYGIGCVAVAPSMAVTERQMDAHRRASEQMGIPLDQYIASRAEKTTLLKRLVMAGDLAKVTCFLCSPMSWPINATLIELAGGASPDIHYELPPHAPWEPGTAE